MRENLDWPQDYDEAIAHAARLGLVTPNGEATDRCQCPTCARVFSTAGNFDKHLTPGRLADRVEGEWCRDPASVGLVQHVRGWWQSPAPEARSWVSVADGTAAEAS